MKTALRLLSVLLVAAAVAACDPDTPTEPTLPTGPATLQITDLTIGTGATLAAGQTITASYELWLYDPNGTDSKGTRLQAGTLPATPLTTSNLIPGWVQGLPGMKVGGKRRLIVPPSLAYGSAGSGSQIPGNAWLVFEIELLSVQ